MALCPFYLSRICLWGFIACEPSVYLGMKRPLKVVCMSFGSIRNFNKAPSFRNPLSGNGYSTTYKPKPAKE
jgi:hypothetical protein